MSGQNVGIVQIPPGIVRGGTAYSVGARWYDGNQVRWYSGLLAPIGGWLKAHTFSLATQAVRDLFSWRDNAKYPWMAAGSADKLFALKVLSNQSFTEYDATPTDLTWSASPMVGYGSTAYGANPYGYGPTGIAPDSTGTWSFDNWGRNLVAVHSQDGRLLQWDPTTPTVKAAQVAGAPISNTLVVVTDERFVMLLGGLNKPRTVKWCSKENITDWTPTETNSAGGFELQSSGTIVAAIRLPGGILVLTDTDAHIIEYIGAPYFYSRRRISEESTCIGKNCITAYPEGAIWVGVGNFWHYDGAVSRVPCDLHDKVFYHSDFSRPSRLSLETNDHNQEIVFSYPEIGSSEPDRYVIYGFGNSQYWSMGDIPRTAWLNPVWTDRPYAANGADLFFHEIGWTADGATRAGVVFAESGALEVSNGNDVMRVDRIYPDFGNIESPDGRDISDPAAVTVTFKRKQAPDAPERVYGPITLDSPKGYKTLRFRARQITARIDQAADEFWVMGKVRLRAKNGGKR